MARKVTIIFTDADGDRRTVGHRQIFIPEAYKAAALSWTRAKAANSPDANEMFHKQAEHDIAFIVPAEGIEVVGFPHWATELLHDGRLPDDALPKTFGDLDGRRAITVGYGNFYCRDYFSREKGCVNDGQRRFGEMSLKSSLQSGEEVYKPPRLWCTGRNEDGINPVQHGDSGGPTFVRATDGRWIFVGYVSGGNAFGNCSSSILAHLELFRKASEFYHSLASTLPSAPAANWEKRQMERFLEEVYDSWSSPNSEALARLKLLYHEDVYVNRRLFSFEEFLAKRTKFAERWPNRDFRVREGSLRVEPDEEAGDPVATVKAIIDWTASNESYSEQERGAFSVSMVVNYHFDLEEQIALGGGNPPQIEDLKCARLSGSAAFDECEISNRKVWSHNGSTMILRASGAQREFVYDAPREGLTSRGVTHGTVLFRGRRQGDKYSGTAYIFTKSCGPQPYEVSGPVDADDRGVTMFGKAPIVNSACKVTGGRDDTLRFAFSEDR
ncbi:MULTISPECIES: hypothetical protein [unclassified Bradyrhizobium]